MPESPNKPEVIFMAAVEIESVQDREAYVEQACANDVALKARVEALLEAHDQSDCFLEIPAVEIKATSDSAALEAEAQTVDHQPGITVGTVIGGRYSLRKKIGEGGMGVVWAAKQSEPVKRKVALKLIKLGMDSQAVVMRFEQERQALALMDHPNIARVLDGGVTSSGQPYFVMELVNGLPLTKFCDEAKLPLRGRLELFLPICQAVQHAHQKGIVHRDLKPANILVTMVDGRPVPMVIDFGVAKATGGKLTEKTISTQFGAVVGTLEYMSPEQAGFSGDDIDTRSDVYSLGVILYELLTGMRPLDGKRLRKAAVTEMIRIICEEEPSKPSTRLSTDDSLPSLAAVRQIEPKKLTALLRGELDWVVMKCLEKQRDRRYETANGLARDVQRFLNDEPVEARPQSTHYRFQKFVRRNRTAAVAVTLVAVTLLIAVGGTTSGMLWALNEKERADTAEQKIGRALEAEQAARKDAETAKGLAQTNERAARQQSQLALNTLTAVITDVQSGLADLPGGGEIRRRLLATSLDNLKQVSTKFIAQSSVSRNTYMALTEMGDVVMLFDTGKEPSRESGTDFSQERQSALVLARSFYQRSHDIAQDLATRHPSDTTARHDHAVSFERLGNVSLKTGQVQESIAFYRQALDLHEDLAAKYPTNAKFQRALAISLELVGKASLQAGNVQDALDSYGRALNVSESLATADPMNRQLQRDMSISNARLGNLYLQNRQWEKALGYCQKYLEVSRALAAADSSDAHAQRDLAGSLEMMGEATLQLGRLPAALNSLERGHEILTKLAADDPTNLRAQVDLSNSFYRLGDVSRRMGRFQDALGFYQQYNQIARRLAAEDTNNTEAQYHLSISYERLGTLNLQLSKLDEAIGFFTKAGDIRQELATADPMNGKAQHDLYVSHFQIAMTYHTAKKWPEAASHFQRATDVLSLMSERKQLVEFVEKARANMERPMQQAKMMTVAMGDWESLLAFRADALTSLLESRSLELVSQSRFDEASEAASKLLELENSNASQLYNAACVLALCADSIKAVQDELTEEQSRQRQKWISSALSALTQAFDAGWDDIEHTKQDFDLSILRERPEFVELIRER